MKAREDGRFGFHFTGQGAVMRKVCTLSALVFVLIVSMFVASIASAGGRHGIGQGDRIKVMTRNLYLGADIFRIVQAINDPDPLSVPKAVAEVFQIMQYTNFVERAEAIADEIQRYKPDLIGLQEVTTIRLQAPGDFILGNTIPNAEEIVYDYIDILTRALAARNLNYRVAVMGTNADVELPMLAGFAPDGSTPVFNDVRMTDHDVILVRSDIETSNPVAFNYTYNIGIPFNDDLYVEFVRGFVAVDVEMRGDSYRFVNTHLEVGGDPDSPFAQIQAVQMMELLASLSGETKPVILAGDFNSSPVDALGQPYSQAIAAGYIDTWSQRKKEEEGFTCCFNETLDDPYAVLFERIDHIFLLPRDRVVKKIKARLVGDRLTDMTPGGLWPSDHAGVVAGIKFFRE